MKLNRVYLCCLSLAMCFVFSGCFTIEQEVFLNPDGSGELVIHISLPDFPEDMASSSKGMGPKKDPAEEFEQLKKDMTVGIPPGLKLKEVKEVRRNGSLGVYAVFLFKDLKDVETALASFGKQSLKEDFKSEPVWTVRLEKRENKNIYTGSFLLNPAEAPRAEVKGKKAAKTEPGMEEMEKLGEEMMQMFLGMVKVRFTLHAPSPITETNADIILSEKTAVWNCSLSAFIKDKKPIEMKAVY